MEQLNSNSENIEDTSHLILTAFKAKGTQAEEVLSWTDIYPFLHQEDENYHYKDVQKRAEEHLRNQGYATPDPTGLRLTPVGYEAVQNLEGNDLTQSNNR